MPSDEVARATIADKVRSLPVGEWPLADRQAWAKALVPSQRLTRGGAGSHLKPITLNDLARRYGYYLDFLQRRGRLDMDLPAGASVNPEDVTAYIQELYNRVGSVTQYGSIYKMRRANQLLDPKRDFSWLMEIEKDLALVMTPRSKSDRLVLSEVLVEAGLTLTAAADSSTTMSNLAKARQVRNGLMVAFLAMHPIRLKNFAILEINRNFVEIDGKWWITLSVTETKEERVDERRIDPLLTDALKLYLEQYRPILRGNNSDIYALWLSSPDGEPMTYNGIGRVISDTTRSTVGISVSPHMFRTSGASTAATYGTDNPNLASALLHHRDERVTQEHYNFASSLSAGRSLRDLIRNRL